MTENLSETVATEGPMGPKVLASSPKIDRVPGGDVD